MERARSYANEVWVGELVVVRINHVGQLGGDPARLLREAVIASRVPPEVRYPEIVSAGGTGEMAWLITRRVRGIELGRAWATMSSRAREHAIRQLAGCLAALHATPCDDVGRDLDPPHTLPLEPMLALVERVIEIGCDPVVCREAAAFVSARWQAFDESGVGLVHGDPHFENVLWDGSRVSALLDFEWSRRSWIDCDLEILLSIAEDPALFAADDYAHEIDRAAYVEVGRWLADAQPGWFAHPRLIDRLEVLHVSRTLGHLEIAPGGAARELGMTHLRRVLAGASCFR